MKLRLFFALLCLLTIASSIKSQPIGTDQLQGMKWRMIGPMVAAAAELRRVLAKLQTDWTQLRTKDINEVNLQLRKASLGTLNP